MTFQGSSSITADKVLGVKGIIKMRLMQFKNSELRGRFLHTCVVDLFSGDGENIVGDRVVNGTPISAVSAYMEASRYSLGYDIRFLMNDIRRDAVHVLRQKIDIEFPSIGNSVEYRNTPAKELLEELRGRMLANKSTRYILTIDPNGPTDFPYSELLTISEDAQLRHQVDIIFNIPMASLKRCYVQADRGKDFKWMSEAKKRGRSTHQILTDVCGKRSAWIRRPIAGDKFQWCVVAAFGIAPPRNDWNRRGYVDLFTELGMEILDSYAFNKSELRRQVSFDASEKQGVLL